MSTVITASAPWWSGGPVTRLAVLVLALAALPVYAVDKARRAMDDEAVAHSVERRITMELEQPTYPIEADARDGVVTLVGATRSLVGKEHAERVAETMRGVRAVVNRIDVEPVVQLDGIELRRDVEAALRAHPAADPHAVDVVADAGRVTLTGTVSSWAAKRLAGTVTKGVVGVERLENRLEVSPVIGPRPDRRLPSVRALRS